MTDTCPPAHEGAPIEDRHHPGRAQAMRMGRARMHTHRLAIRRIRRRVALGAVCLFLLCWLAISGVLVSGHDPALSRKLASAHTRSGSNSTTTSPTEETVSSAQESNTAGQVSESEQTGASPMTTRQS